MGAMRPLPTPMDTYQPGLFRLAGYGGAAVFLRTGVVPDDRPRLVLDVGFLTPTEYVWSLRLPMTQGLAENLAQFFFACASELQPELSVTSVHDPASGLDVRVLASTASRVELQIEVQAGDDEQGVNFETSRVALTRAAEEVRILEAAVYEYGGPTPPMDW